jgi:protein-tyrosine phosphatase
MTPPRTRILFVCLANVCRSPMAEAMLRKLAEEAGLSERLEIDSAGTASWTAGSPPHRGTLEVLARHGIEASGLRSRPVRPADLEEFDWILAMDRANLLDLRALGRPRGRMGLLLELVPGSATLEVPDPIVSGRFDEVYALLDAGCRALMGRLRDG